MASFPTGFLSPTALPQQLSLDLHGHRVPEAREAVKKLFKEAQENDATKLTIVTGLGSHRNSNGTRAVLLNALPKWLNLPEIKSAIQSVKRDMGGYEITLKNPKEDKLLASVRDLQKVVSPLLFPPGQIEIIKKKASEGSSHHLYLLGGMMLEGIIVDQDLEEGAKLVEKAANAGDHFAAMQMGFLCSLGRGVPQSYEASRKWHSKAAENDKEPYSLFVLGTYYWLGQGVIRNDALAIDYLTRAANLGEPVAGLNLGKIYLDGDEKLPRNGKLAQKFLEIGAKGGLVQAQVLLAKQYFFGWADVAVDDEKSRELFLEAAKQDDSVAEYYLGRIYAEGRGVPVDLKAAFEWYQKSADHGDQDAEHTLACAWIAAGGNKRAEGLQRLKKLADSGHKNSQSALGAYYLFGKEADCVKNRGEAVGYLRKAGEVGELEAQKILWGHFLSINNVQEGEIWLRKAAKQEDAASLFTLAFHLEQSPDAGRQKAEILDCYTRAANQKHPKALYLLGLSYLEGDIVKKDVVKGRSLIEQAAKEGHEMANFDLGRELIQSKNKDDQKKGVAYWDSIANSYPPAQTGLGYCYQNGMGVTANPKTSLEWFEKAASNNDGQALLIVGLARLKEGKKKDALEYFLKAVNQGVDSANSQLVALYKNGMEEALVGLKAAAASGNKTAQKYLIALVMEKKISIEPCLWVEKAVAEGDIMTKFAIATLYFEGHMDLAVKILFQVIQSKATNKTEAEVQAKACDIFSGDLTASREDRAMFAKMSSDFRKMKFPKEK